MTIPLLARQLLVICIPTSKFLSVMLLFEDHGKDTRKLYWFRLEPYV
jgi:hypothetical protein